MLWLAPLWAVAAVGMGFVAASGHGVVFWIPASLFVIAAILTVTQHRRAH